jgi:acetylornithine deacetylase/succinyl-diaminopimelate desuccinylase-like protein
LQIERDNMPLTPAPPALVDQVLTAMEAAGLPRVVATKAGCTEAGLYASAGIPSVVFGAGRAAGNIHAPNEWTSIAQLRQAVEFYAAFIEAFCLRC